MKTIEKDKKNKNFIDELREIRDKINLDIKDLNSSKIKEYFNSKEIKQTKLIWHIK